MAQNAVKRARRIAQGEHNGYFISSAVVHELGYYYKTRIIVILGIYIACDDIKAVQLCRGFGTYRRLGLISAPRNVRRRLGGVAEGNCGYVGSVGKVFGTLAYALRMRIYLPNIALLCTAHARKVLAYALPAFGGYEKVVFAEQVVYVAYRTRGRIFYRNNAETYLSRFQLFKHVAESGTGYAFPGVRKEFFARQVGMGAVIAEKADYGVSVHLSARIYRLGRKQHSLLKVLVYVHDGAHKLSDFRGKTLVFKHGFSPFEHLLFALGTEYGSIARLLFCARHLLARPHSLFKKRHKLPVYFVYYLSCLTEFVHIL